MKKVEIAIKRNVRCVTYQTQYFGEVSRMSVVIKEYYVSKQLNELSAHGVGVNQAHGPGLDCLFSPKLP